MQRLLIGTIARALSAGSLVAVAMTICGCGGDDNSPSHAGPAPSNVTASDAQSFVDAINTIRAAVTQPSNYTGTWSSLPNVTWSDPVAASAQGWANQLANQGCTLQHESQTSYGENLAMGTNLTLLGALAMWASEMPKYTWSPTYSIEDFNAGSGHYTQLAWRTSIQVGCGTANCGNSVIISCRFSPPGNVIGQPVY
jgi:pathogenesis-related protein 1